ncbi:neuronal acetylcholine receptor subunit beta-3-like isoform X2 [Convolutriloba macropyga]|uniref:neuronal acetylcholine receptor subunit beta-3-like isoform X2 n=1 Tax=Convolutriloba macropyga TaxID=536237 RepID=UPI003F526EE5
MEFSLTYSVLLFIFTAVHGKPEDVIAQNELMKLVEEHIPRYGAPTDIQNDTVTVFFRLYQIVDIDEKSSTLTTKLRVVYEYTIDSLSWDPEDYQGIGIITSPDVYFWAPPMFVQEAVELKTQLLNKQCAAFDGSISPSDNFVTMTTSCAFDVSKFPNDKQTCNLTFREGSCRQFFVVRPAEDNALLGTYVENEQWELIRPVKISDRSDFCALKISNSSFYDSSTVVTIQLRRRPLFYTFILVIPNVLLYLLSTLVFLLPVDSGEKLSFIATILLAETVTVGTLSSILPSSSMKIPVLLQFVILIVIHLSLLCAATAVAYHVARKTNKNPKIEEIISWKAWRTLRLLDRTVVIMAAQNPEQTTRETLEMTILNRKTESDESAKTIEDRMDKQRFTGTAAESWKIFALLFDRIALINHSLIMIELLV